MSGAPAVFIDKDGTLVHNIPHNVDPARIRLTTGALTGLRRLHEAGFRLIVVTNQAGIAHGLFPEHALRAVEHRLRMLLDDAGLPLDGFYYCPHDPAGSVQAYAVSCDCRKPRPGLIVRAARERGIDLARSWFVGDILNDVEAGRAASCRTVLVDNGNETEWRLSPERMPHWIADDLSETARLILAESRQRTAIRL
jgi:D-glycero-D-manno-heptose 1,7-bisphosphate phosphatase